MTVRNSKKLLLYVSAFTLMFASCSSGSSAPSNNDSSNDGSPSGGDVSAEVINTGIGPKADFCETYRQALRNIPVDYDNAAAQAKAASEIVPSDAPIEIKDYFTELRDLLDESATAEELFAKKTESIENREDTLDGYMDDICGPFNASEASDEGPAATFTELKADGPSMNFEGVTVDVGSIRLTNADPDSALTDNPVATDTDYMILELSFTSTTNEPNQFFSTELKLTMPDQTDNGFTTSVKKLFYTIDDSAGFTVEGNDSASVVAMFRMKDPINSLDGVSFQIERKDGSTSEVLPLG